MPDNELQIKVDLKIDDDKAQSQLEESLKTLKKFTDNKSNNIDIKINVNNSSLSNLEKIEKTIEQINKLSKETQTSLFSSDNSSVTNAIKNQQKLYDERRKQEKAYAEMFDKLEKERRKQIEQSYKSIFDEAIKQEKELAEEKKRRIRELEQEYNRLFKEAEKQEKESIKQAQKERSNSFKEIEKDIQKSQKLIEKLSKSGFVDQDELDKVRVALKEISDIHIWDNIETLNLTDERTELDKVLQTLKQIDDVRLDGLKNAKIENFTSKITNDLDKLEDKFNELGRSTEEIEKLRRELSNLETVAPDKLPTTFQRIRQEVSQLNSELRETSNTTSGLSNFLDDFAGSFSAFALGDIVGDFVADGIRDVVSSFKEMDDAITNVKKVADSADINSSLKLDEIKNQAIDIAKEVGMASTDVINGIADSLQAGMGSMEESIEVARSALMLANVGDMSQEDASSALNTVIKGFNITPLKEVQREVNGAIIVTNELTEAMDMLNHAG